MFYYQPVEAIAFVFAVMVVILTAAVVGVMIELYERISGRSIFGGDGDENKDRNDRSPQGGRRPH